MTVLIRRDDWSRVGPAEIVVRCPQCRAHMTVTNPSVTADGLVVGRPSCQNTGCGFDQQIRLERWAAEP